MTALITILISLLGYGTPSDFANLSEDQIQTEICSLDGGLDGWETPG